MNVAINNVILFLLPAENIFFEIPLRRKILSVSQAKNIVIIQPEEVHNSQASHQLKWRVPLLIEVILSLFLCVLLKREVKCSQISFRSGN